MAFTPPSKVIRWRSVIDRWCVELKVSQSLILAVIQQESGGDPSATRYEPAYERRYILNNSTWLDRCKAGRFSTKEAATSYGLMQLMFPTAWGYGARHPKELLDPNVNVRYGIAHVASLQKKYTLFESLVAYNGGDGAVSGKTPLAWRYADKVFALYERYKEYATREN